MGQYGVGLMARRLRVQYPEAIYHVMSRWVGVVVFSPSAMTGAASCKGEGQKTRIAATWEQPVTLLVCCAATRGMVQTLRALEAELHLAGASELSGDFAELSLFFFSPDSPPP